VKGGPTLVVTKDITKQINDTIARFRKDAVLVGIPEEDTKRDKSDPINNATLLAINEFGSPGQNIPARPAMSIGILNAQDAIAAQFRKAAVTALSQGLAALTPAYERAGIIAANSVKKAINDQEGFAPPSEATLAHRRAAGFNGTKALIVTGQLRNAITSVVKEGR